MVFPEGTRVRVKRGACALRYVYTGPNEVALEAIPFTEDVEGVVIQTVHARHLQPPDKATVVALEVEGRRQEAIFLDSGLPVKEEGLVVMEEIDAKSDD